MNCFLIAFAVLVAFSSAEESKVPKIISPDFVMTKAWEHQVKAQTLQNEFDQAYLNAHGVLNEILGPVVRERLTAFEGHTSNILQIFTPVSERADVLPVDDCRNNVEMNLNSAVNMGGNRGSICMRNYHRDAKEITDGVTKNINDFNENYLKLSQFVYQSFSAMNALLDSEEINQRINATFIELTENFKFDTIDGDQLRSQFAALASKHKDCMKNVEDFVGFMIENASEHIEFCKDIHDIPRASKSARGFRNFNAEFQNIIDNFDYYQW